MGSACSERFRNGNTNLTVTFGRRQMPGRAKNSARSGLSNPPRFIRAGFEPLRGDRSHLRFADIQEYA